MGEPQTTDIARSEGGSERERRAALGLWAVPGVGPKLLGQLREQLGSLAAVLELRVEEWAFDPRFRVPVPLRGRLGLVDSFEQLAEAVEEDASAAGIGICYPGDAAYPEN